MLHGVLDDLDVAIAEQGATVTAEVLGSVYGDAVQLGQLFLNLLNNSLKFKKSDESIAITVKGEALENGFYQIRIQDNGIGFKETELERIFRPFERLHGESNTQVPAWDWLSVKRLSSATAGKLRPPAKKAKALPFLFTYP